MNTQYRVAAHFFFLFFFPTRGPSTIFLPFIFAAFQRCEAIGGILSQQLYMGLFSLSMDFFLTPPSHPLSLHFPYGMLCVYAAFQRCETKGGI